MLYVFFTLGCNLSERKRSSRVFYFILFFNVLVV